MGLDMSLSILKENEHVELMYWRKSWTIHNWFVKKLIVIDNESYPVTKNQLRELINYLNTLKEEDWVIYHIEELESILSEYPEDQTFYYTASW